LAWGLEIDSAPLFKTLSITPVIGVLQNLPPSIRYSFSNTYLMGFAFGKIDYSMMLKPILASWAKAAKGITVQYDKNTVISKSSILYVDSDMRAKAPIQDITAAPGYSACDYCEIIGEYIKLAVRYLTSSIEGFAKYTVRTEARWRACMSQGTAANPCCGIKGRSVMADLPYFLLSKGFVIQPLHLLWEKYVTIR